MSEKLGLVGRKIGMTRIFEEDGKSVPVTVLDVLPASRRLNPTATTLFKSRSARRSPRASTRHSPASLLRLASKQLPR